jgi:hypothetical protein
MKKSGSKSQVVPAAFFPNIHHTILPGDTANRARDFRLGSGQNITEQDPLLSARSAPMDSLKALHQNGRLEKPT